MLAFFASVILFADPHIDRMPPAKIEQVQEGICAALFETPDGRFGYKILHGFHVLERAQQGTFSVEVDNAARVLEIRCLRSSIVPAPWDYRVILSGYDFVIMENPGKRTGRLTRPARHFQFILTEGRLVAEEQVAVDDRLQHFNGQAAKEAASGPAEL